MQTVHGDGEALVGLAADGAIAHGARVEARGDGARVLDLIERDGRAIGCVEVDQVAQAHDAARAVQAGAIRFECLGVIFAHGTLQQVDGLGVDKVVFAAQGAPLGEAERGELVGRGRMRDSLRGIHTLIEFALKLGEAHAANAADRAREAAVDELGCETDGLKDLGGMVALHGGDAHLGHDGHHARRRGAVKPLNPLTGGTCATVGPREVVLMRQTRDVRVGAVRVDAACRVTYKRGKVVCRERVAALDDEVGKGAQPRAHQVVMNRSDGEERRDGDLACARAVGERYDVHAVAHRALDLVAQLIERALKRTFSRIAQVDGAEGAGMETRAVD